jgi:hypothetical protein
VESIVAPLSLDRLVAIQYQHVGPLANRIRDTLAQDFTLCYAALARVYCRREPLPRAFLVHDSVVRRGREAVDAAVQACLDLRTFVVSEQSPSWPIGAPRTAPLGRPRRLGCSEEGP